MFYVPGIPLVGVRSQAIPFKYIVWTQFHIIILCLLYVPIGILIIAQFVSNDGTVQFKLMLIL